MATYTVSGGKLVCTGTDITTQGIVNAVNANSGSLNSVGGSAASASTTSTEYGFRTSTISADFDIGDNSTASTWVAENESITVLADTIRFNNANVRFGLKNSDGTYSNPVFFIYDSTRDTSQQGKNGWLLINGGHFKAYSSTILSDNRLTYETTMGDVTFEGCFSSVRWGFGEGDGTYGTTNSPTVKYIDCIFDNHVGVGLKLYQQIDYVLDRVSVTNNTYGIQPGQDALVLTDSNLDTNTYHSVPNVANCDVTFVNSDITTLRVDLATSSDIHRLVQRFDYQAVDSSGAALSGIKVRIVDQNSDVVVNNEATDSNGRLSTLPTYNGIKCLQYKTYAGSTQTVKANHTFLSYRYGYGLASKTIVVQPNVDIEETDFKLLDASITETNKATVDAYTEIDTSAKFYDRAAAYLEDNLGTYTNFLVTRSGDEIDAGSYNVTIDATASTAFNIAGNLITIKASTFTGDMITTGVITLANGAVIDGTRTDANGTIAPPQPVSITNIVAGSRLQIYNVTTGTEIVNQIVTGTSYSTTYVEGTDYTDGDTVRVRLTYVSGTTAKAEYTTNVIDTSNGWSLLAEQQDNDIYNALAIDGSSVTNFAADYTNDEVDITVATNFNLSDFYAWWVYNMTTAQGIREFFGGITAIDEANFRINTGTLSLYFDNTTSTNLVQLDNRRIFRADGVYPVAASTTGGSGIDVVWRNTILIAETGVSGLTPQESSTLSAIASDSSLIPSIASKTSLILVK